MFFSVVVCCFRRRVVYMQGERLLSAAAPSSCCSVIFRRRVCLYAGWAAAISSRPFLMLFCYFPCRVFYMQGERLLSAAAPSSCCSVIFRGVCFICRVSGCCQQPPLPQVLFCCLPFCCVSCSVCQSVGVSRAVSALSARAVSVRSKKKNM